MQKHFNLYSSRILAALLLLIHALALAVLVLLPVPVWAKLIVTSCLLFSLVYYLRRDAFLTLPTSCVALSIEGDHVVFTTRSGNESAGLLLRYSVVTPTVVILNVLPQGSRFVRSVAIFPDAIAADSFRVLRVAMRWSS